MNVVLKFLIALVGLALNASMAMAVGLAPNDPQAIKRLAAEVQGIMKTKQVPALAVGVVYKGLITQSLVVGHRVAGETTLPVDANTRFRLASMSKTMSAVLVGKLVEQGFLRWDTPVNLLVPSFRYRDANSLFITVDQLMSHRTGLKHHTLDDELEASKDFVPIRAQLVNASLECKIGDCFAYQNMAYNMSADIVYAASGQSFEASMKREIFEPLNMARANIGIDGLSEDDNWARPHERRYGRDVPVQVKPNYYWMPASAGVNASLTDMQKWLIALLKHQPEVIAPSVIDTIGKAQIGTPGETRGPLWRTSRLRSASYGLGIRVFDYLGHPVWYHAGAVAGYRGMIIVVPELDAGMVLMWNGESNLPAGLVPSVLDRWFNIYPYDWLQLSRYVSRKQRRTR